MKSVLAIRHVSYEDLDGFEPILRSLGYTVKYWDAWVSQEGIDAMSPDLLVVLGAPVAVYESTSFSFIKEELAAVEARLISNKPVLGVCFGAQLLAHAAGAAVFSGSGFEFGWHPIELTEHGRTSPLVHLADKGSAVFHCHGDTFDLPHGATLLARTPKYENQAFSLGPHLGIQFHGEVTARGLKRWMIGHTGRIRAEIGHDAFVQSTNAFAPMIEPQLPRFLTEWLTSVELSNNNQMGSTKRDSN